MNRSPVVRLPAHHPTAPVTRVALYSHDTQGLGHLRRNLVIAGALASLPSRPETLLLAGAAELGAFPLPPGTDVLTLPGVRKDDAGTYAPRLGGDLPRLLRLRSEVLSAGLAAFDPDLVIVDKVPGGLEGELEPALQTLRARGRARLVLGLRDVLDAPQAVARDWARAGGTPLVERHYDHVWVYGDPTIYDLLQTGGLPAAVRRKAVFTGYVGQRGTSLPQPHRTALCTVGGGQDGAALARSFATATLPTGWRGLLVAGPHLPDAELAALQRLAADREDLEVVEFVIGCADLIASADAVVSMGGYNTTVEILAAGVPALIVPRVRPRSEQEIRAAALAAHGLVDTCHPAAATPTRLAGWLAGLAGASASRRRLRSAEIDLEGLTRVRELASSILMSPPRSRPQEVHDVAI